MPEAGIEARRRRVVSLAVLMVSATVVTTLAVVSNPPIDQPPYVRIRDAVMLDRLTALGQVREPVVLIALSGLVLLGWRSRRVLFASTAAVLAGWGLAGALPSLLGRARPFDTSASDAGSFPSPSVLVLTVLALVLPMVLEALTRQARIRTPASIVLWAVVLLSGLQEVHASLRWPLDVVGAIALGAGLGLVAQLVAARSGADHPAVVGAGRKHRRADRVLYRVAAVWAVALVAVLGLLTVVSGIPRSTNSGLTGTGLGVPLALGLLTLLLVAVLIARRWRLTGAVVACLAAVLLGHSAAVLYAPWIALLVGIACCAPVVLLWVEWHRTATAPATLGLAAFVSVLLAGTLAASVFAHTHHWGPTHPQSAAPAPDVDLVEWMWAGAVSTDRVTVRAASMDDARVRLAVSSADDMSEPRFSAPDRADEANGRVVALSVTGLQPDTSYHYALEVDGNVDDRRGRFRTFPAGSGSFRFAVGADSSTGSNSMVFDAVRATEPLFYLNVGDFFYGDVDVNDPGRYRSQYEANLTSPAQAALYAAAPVAYTWGDHDFAGNGADRSAPGRPAALRVYRQYVPHYPLVAEGPQGPIHQAFTVGRVRFILTDNRSQRDTPGAEPRWMLGPQQHAWLVAELARADDYAMVVWANPDPWVDDPDPTSDAWAGFAWERRRIARAIADHDVDNLLMVSGDAHMLAYDDGTHTNYAGTGGAGFPLLHAAALDREPSVKGGPYTGPVIAGSGQFGIVDVRDDGRRLTATLTGRNMYGRILFTKRFRPQ